MRRSRSASPACRARVLGLLSCLAMVIVGCNDGRNHQQAIAVLVDTSGTYATEAPEVARILKREVLPNMITGDTLIVIRIDSESFDKENVAAIQTLDWRPSQANAQKLALAQQLDSFAETRKPSKFTDIRGAMMLASSYLRETLAGRRVMLVFSDMREELPDGAVREFGADEFDGVELVAMNVKPLRADTHDPNAFRDRLTGWESEVMEARAASWSTFMDSAKLGEFLIRSR